MGILPSALFQLTNIPGGSIVDSVDSCTVLITEHVKRSQKLLEAIGRGRPICSPQWVLDSKRAKQFLGELRRSTWNRLTQHDLFQIPGTTS